MIPDERLIVPEAAPPCPAGIRIAAAHWEQLNSHLLADGYEHAAVLLCGIQRSANRVTFLVQKVIELVGEDFLSSGALHLSIAPRSLARVTKQARSQNATLVLCHSHPFPGAVRASSVDLRTEIELCGRVFPGRLHGLPSAALVLGPDGLDGRVWDQGAASPLTEVTVVGSRIARLPSTSSGVHGLGDSASVVADEDLATARQALLWGALGQRTLRDAQVAVIGCGGTGSHVVTQLAHLRVGNLTLVDPDIVETTNLSRIVGSSPSDVGRQKVDVLAEHARRINPSATVTPVAASLLDIDPQTITGADVIVCATDGHGSRALLTEIAQQYIIPVIDLGVEVDPASETFRAGGGVRVLRPGHGCLHCARTLSAQLVREEYLDEAQREVEIERGYLRGESVPAPSVIALNGVVASLAVLEVCQLIVGMLGGGRDRVLYRAESRALTTASMPSDAECFVCGENGILGHGEARVLPTRWRAAADVG